MLAADLESERAVRSVSRSLPTGVESAIAAMKEDTAIIAGQLADLTRTVENMAGQLKTLQRAR